MKNYYWKLILLLFVFGILTLILNTFFGWFGYEKWKYRRSTRGNIYESLERGVFVESLPYSVSPSNVVVSFSCFIEKGYKYGYLSSNSTRLDNSSKFPYQVSFSQNDTINDLYFSLDKGQRPDSSDDYCIYLKKPSLDQEIRLNVMKNTIDTNYIIAKITINSRK